MSKSWGPSETVVFNGTIFNVRFAVQSSGAWIDVAVHELISNRTPLLYYKIGGGETDDWNEASALIRGSIKFDSSAHLYWGENGSVFIGNYHHAMAISQILAFIYDKAKTLILTHQPGHEWLWD